MRAYAAMNDEDRLAVKDRIAKAQSREDIRVIAMSLAHGIDAVEYH